jgi:hypothetical protein
VAIAYGSAADLTPDVPDRDRTTRFVPRTTPLAAEQERPGSGLVWQAKEVLMPSTRSRVPDHTSDRVNEEIRQEAERRLQYFEDHPEEIDRRLCELNEEWDIERAIEANAAILAFTGVALGARDRRWLVLPALVTTFLLQHALQGWCPPVPVLRRLGFRTSYEIEEERRALQALRGDHEDLPKGKGRGLAAFQMARSV